MFQEALQEQLGLKMKSMKATMGTLIIDHVERPSEKPLSFMRTAFPERRQL